MQQPSRGNARDGDVVPFSDCTGRKSAARVTDIVHQLVVMNDLEAKYGDLLYSLAVALKDAWSTFRDSVSVHESHIVVRIAWNLNDGVLNDEVAYFPGHWAPNDLLIYTGKAFPAVPSIATDPQRWNVFKHGMAPHLIRSLAQLAVTTQ